MNRQASRNLTYKVHLAGGQDRLREMVLYVAVRAQHAPRWGKTKLNKMLWRADFDSFALRGVPVTGRTYQRLEHGPAPVEMVPVLRALENDGALRFEASSASELRVIPLRDPSTKLFSLDDLDFVDRSIAHYWGDTAKEASDDSHGLPWLTRLDNEPMPYEGAYLSERKLSLEMAARLKSVALERLWVSQ